MRIRVLVSSALVLLFHAVAWSCSCIYIPTFCETLTFGDGVIDTNYLIVHARAEDKLHDGLRVSIISKLFGATEDASLVIRKGNGADCLVNTDVFAEGKEYVFAFHGKYDGKYNLFYCGVTWLPVENGIATGEITETLKSHPVSRFDEIVECPGLKAGLGRVGVYPNPASTTIKIAIDIDIEQWLNIEMYDMAGRLVLTRMYVTAHSQYPYDLDVRSLAQGIYFLRINYGLGGVAYEDKVCVVTP